jgi:hypothetical protein
MARSRPTDSMAALISVASTGPPPSRRQLAAISPVPDARSSSVLPGPGRMRVAKMRFQMR